MLNDFKTFLRLMLHVLFTAVIVGGWIMCAWAIDKLLLGHFPVEGMSLYSVRALEVALHVALGRLVYKKLIFPDDEKAPPRSQGTKKFRAPTTKVVRTKARQPKGQKPKKLKRSGRKSADGASV